MPTPGAQFVRRRPGEAFEPDCIVPTVKYGGGSVMIWGCMTANGVGEVYVCEGRMNSSRYIDMLEEVLEPSIVKLFDSDEEAYIFQQDNAPCHKSKRTTEWFSANNVPVFEWPAQSPDLSPIENLWHILKRNVAKHRHKNKNELKARIFEEWEKISPEVCSKLVATMPKRLQAVIKCRGGATKY